MNTQEYILKAYELNKEKDFLFFSYMSESYIIFTNNQLENINIFDPEIFYQNQINENLQLIIYEDGKIWFIDKLLQKKYRERRIEEELHITLKRDSDIYNEVFWMYRLYINIFILNIYEYFVSQRYTFNIWYIYINFDNIYFQNLDWGHCSGKSLQWNKESYSSSNREIYKKLDYQKNMWEMWIKMLHCQNYNWIDFDNIKSKFINILSDNNKIDFYKMFINFVWAFKNYYYETWISFLRFYVEHIYVKSLESNINNLWIQNIDSYKYNKTAEGYEESLKLDSQNSPTILKLNNSIEVNSAKWKISYLYKNNKINKEEFILLEKLRCQRNIFFHNWISISQEDARYTVELLIIISKRYDILIPNIGFLFSQSIPMLC